MGKDQSTHPAPPGQGRWGDGYAMVPGWLLARGPSGNALLVYTHLAMHGRFDHATGVYDECRPSVKRLAEGDPDDGYGGTGLSTSSVNRAIRELRQLRAIVGTVRYRPDGGQLPTVYRVHFGRVAPPDEPTPVSPVTGGGVTGDRGGSHQRQGGSTTGDRGGLPPVVQDPEPSTQNHTPTPPAAPSQRRGGAGVASGGWGDTTTDDPEGQAGADGDESDRRRVAAELVAAVPGLSSSGRGRLARRAAQCLAAGHPPQAVAAELAGDLAGAGEPVAVLMTRLGDLADSPVSAREAPARARPRWCGKCDEVTRLTVEEVPARCPRCHPLVADPGPGEDRAASAAGAERVGGNGSSGACGQDAGGPGPQRGVQGVGDNVGGDPPVNHAAVTP